MNFRLILLSFALLSCSVIARGQQISGTQTRSGFDYSIKVSDEDLRDTPAWNPEKEDAAPVSLRKAIEIARANLKRFAPESTEKWDVEKVALHQMGKDRWLYEVSFYCFLATCGGDDSGGFTLYVKMDGTILEPEKTPNGSKALLPAAKPNNPSEADVSSVFLNFLLFTPDYLPQNSVTAIPSSANSPGR